VSDSSGEGLRRAFERAGAQREAAASAPAAEGVRALTFTLSGEWHAFRLSDLVEIVGGVEPTPLPFAPPFILGVVNHRGAIVPVVDLRRAFGLPVHFRRGVGRTVLVRHGGTTIGFVADSISSIVTLDPASIGPPLETMEAERARFLEGCVRGEKGLLALLSVPAIIEGLRARPATG
jgi:purine-binding chemotaxis protein CheW